MKAYQCKAGKLPGGSNYERVTRIARQEYHALQDNPRRLTHVRCPYFKKGRKKGKVFVDQFWEHLKHKQKPDRTRRLKLFACAIELITESDLPPITRVNPTKPREVLHRFFGLTREGELFCVQIKENKRSGRKYFISVFPFSLSKEKNPDWGSI